MSAVKEIETAIAKLTELRDASNYSEFNGWLVEPVAGASGAIDDPGYAPLTQDDLIVTLHRTIDAQLTILNGTLRIRAEFVNAGDEQRWLSAIERAGDLALARAINNAEPQQEEQVA